MTNRQYRVLHTLLFLFILLLISMPIQAQSLTNANGAQPSCPEGQVLSVATGQCETPAGSADQNKDYGCAPGESYVPELGKCQLDDKLNTNGNTQCPPDQVLNPDDGKCHTVELCPAGKMMDEKTQQCVDLVCPSNQKLSQDGSHCVYITCPSGQFLDEKTGNCVENKPNDGTNLSTANDTKDPTCPQGKVLDPNTKQCVDEKPANGTNLNTANDTKDPACPQDKVLDANTKQCVDEKPADNLDTTTATKDPESAQGPGFCDDGSTPDYILCMGMQDISQGDSAIECYDYEAKLTDHELFLPIESVNRLTNYNEPDVGFNYLAMVHEQGITHADAQFKVSYSQELLGTTIDFNEVNGHDYLIHATDTGSKLIDVDVWNSFIEDFKVELSNPVAISTKPNHHELIVLDDKGMLHQIIWVNEEGSGAATPTDVKTIDLNQILAGAKKSQLKGKINLQVIEKLVLVTDDTRALLFDLENKALHQDIAVEKVSSIALHRYTNEPFILSGTKVLRFDTIETEDKAALPKFTLVEFTDTKELVNSTHTMAWVNYCADADDAKNIPDKQCGNLTVAWDQPCPDNSTDETSAPSSISCANDPSKIVKDLSECDDTSKQDDTKNAEDDPAKKQCPDGTYILTSQSCTNKTFSICGNGIVEAGEECDKVSVKPDTACINCNVVDTDTSSGTTATGTTGTTGTTATGTTDTTSAAGTTATGTTGTTAAGTTDTTGATETAATEPELDEEGNLAKADLTSDTQSLCPYEELLKSECIAYQNTVYCYDTTNYELVKKVAVDGTINKILLSSYNKLIISTEEDGVILVDPQVENSEESATILSGDLNAKSMAANDAEIVILSADNEIFTLGNQGITNKLSDSPLENAESIAMQSGDLFSIDDTGSILQMLTENDKIVEQIKIYEPTDDDAESNKPFEFMINNNQATILTKSRTVKLIDLTTLEESVEQSEGDYLLDKQNGKVMQVGIEAANENIENNVNLNTQYTTLSLEDADSDETSYDDLISLDSESLAGMITCEVCGISSMYATTGSDGAEVDGIEIVDGEDLAETGSSFGGGLGGGAGCSLQTNNSSSNTAWILLWLFLPIVIARFAMLQFLKKMQPQKIKSKK
jgi:hypothetical protein